MPIPSLRALARPRPVYLLALAALAALPSLAYADAALWLGGSGEWTTPANWSTNAAPNAPDALAFFQAAGTTPLINLAANATLGTLLFDAPATSYRLASLNSSTLTLSSTTGTASLLVTAAAGASATSLTLAAALASNLTLTNNATGNLLFSGPLSGTGNLLLTGTGQVTLTGNNSNWSPAQITIAQGTLSTVGGTLNSLGNPTSGTVTVAPGASLDLTGITAPNTSSLFTKTLQLSGNGAAASAGALAFGSTNTTLLGPVVLNNGATLFAKSATALLNLGDPSGATPPGATPSLSGTGPLIKTGLGTLQLNIPSTHTGGTLVNAGTLTVNPTGSLVGTGTTTVNPGGKLTLKTPAGTGIANSVSPNAILLNGGVLGIAADLPLGNLLAPASTSGVISLDLNAPFTAGGTNLVDFSALPASSLVRLGATGTATLLPASLALVPDAQTHTLRFGGALGTLTLASPLADVNGAPTNVDYSAGNQTILLTGTSSYTGTTTVNGAVNVLANAPAALGSPAGTAFLTGGTLTLNAPVTHAFVQSGGTFLVNNSASGSILLKGGIATITQPGTADITLQGGSLTLNTQWAQPITQTGGTLTLPVAVTAPLLVSGGTVNFNTAAATPMTLSGGAVLINATSSGLITLNPGGLVRQLANGNFAPQSVLLAGGTLSLTTNLPLAPWLAPASTGGVISLDAALAFTNGTTNTFDFSALPGGPGLALASTSNATLGANITLKPDNTTHTLRFGALGATGTLTLNMPLIDYAGVATNISVTGPTTVVLPTVNTFTGLTTISGNVTATNAFALGSGTGSDADGTVINTGGKLTATGITFANEKFTLNGGSLFASSNAAVTVLTTGTLSGTFNGPIDGAGTVSVTGVSAFNAPNTYTGPTSLFSGTLTVANGSNLGDTIGATTVQSSLLRINGSSNESITLTASTLTLGSGGSLGAPVTSIGSTLIGGTSNNPITALILGNANQTLPITTLIGGMTISGGVSGAGNLAIGTAFNALTVTINGPVTHSGNISVNAGTLLLTSTAPVLNPITVGSNTLFSTNTTHIESINLNPLASGFPAVATFASPISIENFVNTSGNATFASAATINSFEMISGSTTFNGPAVINTLQPSEGSMVLNGPSFFNAPLTFTMKLTANAPLSVEGTINVRGSLTLNAAGVISNPLVISRPVSAAALIVNVDTTLPSLTLGDNANITVAPSATLTIQNGELVVRSGQIVGKVAGFTSLRKISPGQEGFGNATQFIGPISVDKGTLAVDTTFAGSITLTDRTNAFLFAAAGSPAIFLNNAVGKMDGSFSQSAFVMGGIEYAGHLDVGTIGSSVGNGTLSGAITGSGDLIISQNPVTFRSSTSTFSGLTRLYSTLELIPGGQLTSPSGVVLYGNGILSIVGDGSNKVRDDMPISGYGGIVTLSRFNGSPTSVAESVGAFNAVMGNSTISLGGTAVNSTYATGSTLVLSSLTRAPGAVVTFLKDFTHEGTPDPNAQISFLSAPALHNGIIGGWAIFNQYPGNTFLQEAPTFATYGPSGIVALTTVQTDLNAALPTENVSLAANAALAAPKTINSLRLVGSTLNLSGNTLSVDSGGLIISPLDAAASAAPLISNGVILPTATTNGELIITGKGTIAANIVDLPGGTTQLTVGGINLVLAGSNSYSGATHVVSNIGSTFGGISFSSPFAIPAGNNLFLDAGNVTFDFTSSSTITLGTLTTGPNYVQLGSTTPISATNFSINELGLGAPLVGNGPMTITGRLTIGTGGDLSAFQGPITINDGGVLTTATNAFNKVLGAGLVTVNAGGQVVLQTTTLGNLTLNGGRLISGYNSSNAPSAGTLTGNVHLTASSKIADVTLQGTILTDPATTLTLEDATVRAITGAGSIIAPRYMSSTSDGVIGNELAVDGNFTVRANGSSSGTSKVNNLSIGGTTDAWFGKLDIANNLLIVDTADPTDKNTKRTALRNQITSGAAAKWTGNGITSATAAADTLHKTVVLADNALLGLTQFGGLPVDANSLLIAATWYGDSNLDRQVNVTDLGVLATFYGQAVPNGVLQGDFNQDGVVNVTDLGLLATNYGQGTGGQAFSLEADLAGFPVFGAAVPEPASGVALMLAVPLLLRRRKK